MHWIDLLIFLAYMLAMLGVGFYFLKKNKTADDYYVGGRSMGSLHIGLSVVATDVGGGFSIGLGGLGFAMGLSGSWMLFTGLLGAWLAAVVLIPKVRSHPAMQNFTTLPQIYGYFFNKKVALAAGLISAIGYIGFTSSQLLAGAKLASGTFADLGLNSALLIMGVLAVVYTAIGGIKAVIYTDTVQWIILMSGLIFIGLPISYYAVGGWASIEATVSPEMLELTNIDWVTIVNWAITIIPIWFVGMTLYQRIFACKDVKTAKRAWYIAGLFEWPIMAFMGIALGLLARVAAEQGMFASLGYASAEAVDAETGLAMLLRITLPVGLMGLMLSSYFSAILSTADSCLMAASGNVLTDLIEPLRGKSFELGKALKISQILTLAIGGLALCLASGMSNVLSLMLYSYAFMVSGLLVPLLAALFLGSRNSLAALIAMIAGGSVTLFLTIQQIPLPYGLDANIFGLSASAATFGLISVLYQPNKKIKEIA
jgi:SSS family solute:Na+ symporter